MLIMENDLKEYIRKMFESTRPEWNSSYEGVLLYDIDNNVWIGGDNIGWVEIKEE